MPIPDSQKYVTSFDGTEYPYGNLSVNSGAVAPSGYGLQYDKLFAANPYRNLNYKKSFWQSVASGLGFRTKADDYAEQAQVNAAEYDADIFALMQQNDFNSPSEQAQRMRAAGLNPDLLGTDGVAEGAAPRNDANGMQPTGDDSGIANAVGAVCSGLLDIVPQAMSFMVNLSQLRGVRLENDAKELAFGSSAVDAASKFFLEGITEQDYRDAFDRQDFTNLLTASKKNSDYLARTLLSSRSARKKWQLAYNMHANSLIGKMQKYKTYGDFESARKDLLGQRASSRFSDDDETMSGLLSAFIQPIEAYQAKMNDIQLRRANLAKPELAQNLENAQMANQLEYEQSIDAAGQAAAENAVNRATEQEQEIITATNELFSSIMTNLSQQDSWWSKIAMALVGIARAQLLSGMHMSFGRNANSQYKVNGDTGVLSESGQSSSNFGISF